MVVLNNSGWAAGGNVWLLCLFSIESVAARCVNFITHSQHFVPLSLAGPLDYDCVADHRVPPGAEEQPLV